MRAIEKDWQVARNEQLWPGDTCCLKQYDATGRDYVAFGIITNSQEPVTIYLRGKGPEDDFKQMKEYATFADMFNDNWVVD